MVKIGSIGICTKKNSESIMERFTGPGFRYRVRMNYQNFKVLSLKIYFLKYFWFYSIKFVF